MTEVELSELKKCSEDPLYSYNNYTKQGKVNPISRQDYDLLVKYTGAYVFLKYRRGGYIPKVIEQLKQAERYNRFRQD